MFDYGIIPKGKLPYLTLLTLQLQNTSNRKFKKTESQSVVFCFSEDQRDNIITLSRGGHLTQSRIIGCPSSVILLFGAKSLESSGTERDTEIAEYCKSDLIFSLKKSPIQIIFPVGGNYNSETPECMFSI